ncbi:hypothetical protein D3C78_1455630 [compost metagenome]
MDVRTKTDGCIVHRQDDPSPANRIPVFQLERPVMNATLFSRNEGDVMCFVLTEQPCTHQLSIGIKVAEQSLSRLEVQRLNEKSLCQRNIIGFEQAMIEARHSNSFQISREHRRVEQSDCGVGELHFVIELQHMS